jgi:hypothetical protein
VNEFGTPTVARLAAGEWLFDGYRRALARFREAERRHDEPQETFIALFETLSWASSIGDFLKKRRQALYPGIDAIDWIRDRVLHQWADAIESRPIFMGPITSSRSGVRPGPFFFWHWRQPEEIPAPDKNFDNPKGEAAYREVLAGRTTREALDEIERFLDSRK